MNTVELLDASADAAIAVARGVQDSQLAAPTPCTEWDVRALMQHAIGTLTYLTDLADGRASGPPQPAQTTDLQDTADKFGHAARTAVERWRGPGALDQKIESFGGMSGEFVAGIVLGELLVHGWDLATATGQGMPVDDAVSDAYLRRIRDEFQRQSWAYGPEVQPTADATAIDRVAAFLGRAFKST